MSCENRSRRVAALVVAQVVALLVGGGLAGCGSEPTDNIVVHQEYATVLDQQGQRQTIPASELVARHAGESPFRSVLTIDRRTGREAWVPVEQLGTEPPSRARFILLTRTDPAADAAPAD